MSHRHRGSRQPPAGAGADAGATCDPDGHCITCSDEGRPMRVVSVDAELGIACCEDERGRRTEVLTGLLDRVGPGDVLLVHAGTALLRLDPAPRDVEGGVA